MSESISFIAVEDDPNSKITFEVAEPGRYLSIVPGIFMQDDVEKIFGGLKQRIHEFQAITTDLRCEEIRNVGQANRVYLRIENGTENTYTMQFEVFFGYPNQRPSPQALRQIFNILTLITQLR